MDRYIRVARVYPAVLGTLPTCILLAMCMGEWFPQYQVLVGNLQWVLCRKHPIKYDCQFD